MILFWFCFGNHSRAWVKVWIILKSLSLSFKTQAWASLKADSEFKSCDKLRYSVFHKALSVKKIDLAETPFWGVHAWPLGHRGPNQPPKNYLRGPWKFCAGLLLESKVTALFCSDGRTHGWTHGHTKMNHLTTTKDFFCICGGKHNKTYKIATSSLREGLTKDISNEVSLCLLSYLTLVDCLFVGLLGYISHT